MTPDERSAALKATELRLARWTDAEYNTATARCRSAKQFDEFLEPDRKRLFPNLQWIATRSVTPRADHAAYVGLVFPKGDPFWDKHLPGSEWNCKCDIQETAAEPSTQTHIPDLTPPRGLEGNPAKTGEVFTDNVGYIRNASADWSPIKETSRKVIRQQNANYSKTFKTNIGDVLVDEITIWETSKGASCSDSYFIKQEIAKNIGGYMSKIKWKTTDETIDLSHNKHSGKFYQRKKLFSAMKVGRLTIKKIDYKGNEKTYNYQLKFGRFNDDHYNLYSITEPE